MATKTPQRPRPASRPSGHPARRHGYMAALREAAARRTRRRRLLLAALVLAVIAGVVTAMMLSSQPTSSSATRIAPTFTLPTTAGSTVSLADYRGKNVVLFFSEGAGCGSCLQQMAAIEKDPAAFDKANVVVLPIVMNTRDQITKDMATYGVKTPYLLDDGTVSREYGMLGKGMHADLPGHGFVLIDPSGIQRWKGEYPSMWLPPADVLSQVEKHLGT